MKLPTTERPAALLALIAGFTAWAVCFVLLYSVLSLGCAAELQARTSIGVNALSVLLVAVWVAHLAVLVWLLQAARRSGPATDIEGRTPHSFLVTMAVILNALALASTIWFGLPVLFLPPCI